MNNTNPFLQIRNKAGDSERSMRWYQDQIRSLMGGYKNNPTKLLKTTVDFILPGNMYMFYYDAKHKDILPYWDMFPLVLPFQKVNDGFYGINLHYMDYRMRFNLLSVLQEYALDTRYNENTRIQASWKLLSGLANTNTVKHYLYSHVRSRFQQVHFPDWKTAALLPTERFIGASKQKVWKDTRGR